MAAPYVTSNNDEGSEESSSIRRYGEIEEHIDAIESGFHEFRKFEVLEHPPSDHYFKPWKLYINRPKSELIERMKEEWEMLRRYYYESIYIRAYQERPDLMRAIIIGPEATPYRKGLFCFDIQFPTNYPNQPPRIFFRSYFHCSIPNFTSNGMLNLEPLHNGGNSSGKSFFDFKNIFSPPNSKSTTTLTSSVLQTLTTIQSFFSAHETSRLVDHEKRVIMQTASAMRHMLKSTPQDFKVFVYGYFRTQAHQILMNFKFHLVLDETTRVCFFVLIKAFEDNGTYCQHHYNKEAYGRGLLQLTETHDQKQSENFTITKRKPTSSQDMY